MICFKASSSPPTKVTTSDKLCFRWQEEICPETWFSQNQSLLPQNFLFFNYLQRGGPDCKCVSIINAMRQGRPSFLLLPSRGGRGVSRWHPHPPPRVPMRRTQLSATVLHKDGPWMCLGPSAWWTSAPVSPAAVRLSSCNSKLAWCWM